MRPDGAVVIITITCAKFEQWGSFLEQPLWLLLACCKVLLVTEGSADYSETHSGHTHQRLSLQLPVVRSQSYWAQSSQSTPHVHCITASCATTEHQEAGQQSCPIPQPLSTSPPPPSPTSPSPPRPSTFQCAPTPTAFHVCFLTTQPQPPYWAHLRAQWCALHFEHTQ